MTRQWKMVCTGLVSLLGSAVVAAADRNDWAEGISRDADGATREYYNAPVQLRWQHRNGDWFDRNGTAQGNQPFASVMVSPGAAATTFELDVTTLVQQWQRSQVPQRGFLLRVKTGQGAILRLASREHENGAWHPQLRIESGQASTQWTLEADAFLEPTTYKSTGAATGMRISSSGQHGLLRFSIAQSLPVQRAILRVTAIERSGTAGELQVYGINIPVVPPRPLLTGLAQNYPQDIGIANDQDVVFAANFEQANWRDPWRDFVGNVTVLDSDTGFEPVNRKALRVRLKKGDNYGTSLGYYFDRDNEPEKMYARYYLRLGSNWRPVVDGGKLPGFAGTYGRAGWGGRGNDGTNGWSARGAFLRQIGENNPLEGLTAIGSYVYEVNPSNNFGAQWVWNEGEGAYLTPNRWYCVEQLLQMNTPGQSDGIVQAWIDGREVYNRRNVLLRTVPTLKIEKFWLDVYHGGTAKSPYDQDIYIDQLVIARRYIGPMLP